MGDQEDRHRLGPCLSEAYDMTTALDYLAWSTMVGAGVFLLYCFASAAIETIREHDKDAMKILVFLVFIVCLVVWSLFRILGGV